MGCKETTMATDGQIRQRKKAAGEVKESNDASKAKSAKGKEKNAKGEKAEKLTEREKQEKEIVLQEQRALKMKKYTVVAAIQVVFVITAIVAVRGLMNDKQALTAFTQTWEELKGYNWANFSFTDVGNAFAETIGLQTPNHRSAVN